MTADFTKFPFSTIVNPAAATLTEAIVSAPVDFAYVIITIKSMDVSEVEPAIRALAAALRAGAANSGLTDITAYRQLRRDELGGAIPFDQPICEAIVAAAATHTAGGTGAQAMATVFANPLADWIMLLEYRGANAAAQATKTLTNVQLNQLTAPVTTTFIGAFKNMKRYSSVSRDPNVIQFFNLFGAPGDLDVLWSAWQDALPWFFEIAEFRSSFPLLALDRNQDILLVNYAHVDSTKHFLNGALHDPAFAASMASNYVQRNVTLPTPFFCKIVPV